MTDTTLNRFLASGLAADRAAFTPTPPTPASGPDPLYLWFETDTGDTYAWDLGTSAWVQVNNGAGATIAWGDLTGTLADQTDLQAALDAKAAITYVDTQDAATLTSAQGYADAADGATLTDARDYTDAAIASIAGSGEGAPLNGIVSGCGVAYTGSLGFAMSAGSAYIDGTLVTAAAQTITLDAADGTNPRIDVLYLDDAGTFGKITGTPSASPSQPAVDPTSQLYLTFVLVPAAATDLTSGITTELIYDEGSEWTPTTSGSGFTANSTNNPNTGTKCIEGTTVAAGAYVKFVDGSPASFDGDGNLLLSIRSKATWNAKRSLTLQWYASGVAKGSAITLKQGVFGFDSSNTASYQLLVIGKALFSVPAGTTADEFRITAAGSGGSAIGFYIDPIKLQTVTATSGGGGGSGSGFTQEQADARYVQQTRVSDAAYDATAWNGSTDLATKNAIRDKVEAVVASIPAAPSTVISDAAYGAGWNGETGIAPSKNAVYDKIEAIVAGIPGSYTDEQAQDAIGTILTDTGLAVVTYSDATPSIDVNVPAAAGSDFRTGTDATKALTSDACWDAADYVTLNDSGGNIAVDLSTGLNFKMTMDGDYTLSAPSNGKPGQTGVIVFTQDGTGTQTLGYNAVWKFAGGTDPVLSTAAGTVDLLFYQVLPNGTDVYANLVKAIA